MLLSATYPADRTQMNNRIYFLPLLVFLLLTKEPMMNNSTLPPLSIISNEEFISAWVNFSLLVGVSTNQY